MSRCTGRCNQGRDCTCCDFDPREEGRDLVDLALDFVQVLLVLGFLTFIIFGLLGYWSAL